MTGYFKILFFSILLFSTQCFAQLIDVLEVHAGLSVFPKDEKINIAGLPENIYGGYTAGQTIGLGASKFITDKLQLGASVDYMRTSKDHFGLDITKTSVSLKFNFLTPDIYRISPYIIANGNFLYVVMSQTSAYIETSTKNPDYSGAGNVSVDKIGYRNPSLKYFSPVFGGGIGGGVDFNIFSIYSLFVEATYNYNIVTSTVLQDSNNKYLKDNKSELAYTNLLVGIRIYMY